MKQQTEYERFDTTMGKLLKVSHEEIKAKLDAEKAAKKMRQQNRRPNRKSPLQP